MSDPSFYCPAPFQVEVRETHVSIVFLAGDRAYKLKKPVCMPFLDYSTPARRRHFCEQEVRLNRRSAPDIYLGVRAIAERGQDLILAEPDHPAALEYAVVMRRFDDEATLERLAERREADEPLAERVGNRVAELHLAAPSAPAGCWTPAYVRERLDENFATTQPEVGTLVDRLTFDAVRRFSLAFLESHETLLERRIAADMVRDVHGDLRAEHIVIEPGRLSIVDCVDFDDRMRRMDVAADLAFLIMDLERLGAHPAARAVERAYLARTADADLHELLLFYACYAAWVRGKVTGLRVRQLDADDPARPGLEQRARELFALSHRLGWRARLPLVVILCGVAGSGKSTLAAELSARSGLPHLGSDRVRKELAGLSPDMPGAQKLYTPSAQRRPTGSLRAAQGQRWHRAPARSWTPRCTAATPCAAARDRRPAPVGRVHGARAGAAQPRRRARARPRAWVGRDVAGDGRAAFGMGAAGRRSAWRPPRAVHRPAGGAMPRRARIVRQRRRGPLSIAGRVAD